MRNNATTTTAIYKKSGVYREYAIISFIAWFIPAFVIVCPLILVMVGTMNQSILVGGLFLAFALLLIDVFVVMRLVKNVQFRRDVIDIDPKRQSEANRAIYDVMSNNNWIATQGAEQLNFVKQSRLLTMPTVSVCMMSSDQGIQANVYISDGAVDKYGFLKRPVPALKMKDAILDALASYQSGAPNGTGRPSLPNPPASSQQTAQNKPTQYVNL